MNCTSIIQFYRVQHVRCILAQRSKTPERRQQKPSCSSLSFNFKHCLRLILFRFMLFILLLLLLPKKAGTGHKMQTGSTWCKTAQNVPGHRPPLLVLYWLCSSRRNNTCSSCSTTHADGFVFSTLHC